MSNDQAVAYARIQAEPGSRLEQLAAMYPEVKAQFDEAETRLESVKAAIKVELTKAAPGATSIDLAGPVPLHLAARNNWRIDAKAMKAADPKTYVRWAVKSTSWVLTAVRS